MSERPDLRVADILRRHGHDFLQEHTVTPLQARALRLMMLCRTPALGGHLDLCDDCGHVRPAYNSCRDRHCPSCQAGAQHDWIEQRMKRVLPTHHFHVVFTLPQELRDVALRHGDVVYDLLLRSAARTLLDVSQSKLHAQPGITAVLHTWTRALLFHPHVHCIVTGGGLQADGQTWVPTPKTFLFHVNVLRARFSSLIRQGLLAALDEGSLTVDDDPAFRKLLRSLGRKKWVVYCKQPFAGPEHIYRYLGRYTHRVGISDQRLIAVTDEEITFRTRGAERVTLTPEAFIRRLLLHVLPSGFHKIRQYGLYAGANVHTRLEQARGLLPPVPPAPAEQNAEDGLEAFQEELKKCPACGGEHLRRIEVPRPTARELHALIGLQRSRGPP